MDHLERLRHLINQNDLSVKELSELSNIPQSTINSLFSRNYLPSIPTLEALCNGMNITLSEFFFHKDEKTYTNDTEEILQKWTYLSSHQRRIILDLIDLLLD